MMGTFAAVCCILMAVTLLTLVCQMFIRREKFLEDVYFDERQAAQQGKGYKLGFWVGIAYFMVILIFLELGDICSIHLEIESYLLMFFGVAIQIITVHIHRLLTHSVLPLSEKPKYVIIGYILFGLSQVWGLLELNVHYDGYPFTGPGTTKWVRLIMAVTAFLLAGAHLLSLLWKEKEDG